MAWELAQQESPQVLEKSSRLLRNDDAYEVLIGNMVIFSLFPFFHMVDAVKILFILLFLMFNKCHIC